MLVLAGVADAAEVQPYVDIDLARATVVQERGIDHDGAQATTWDTVVVGAASIRYVRAAAARLDLLGVARRLRVAVVATDRPWLVAAPGELRPVVAEADTSDPEPVGHLALRAVGGRVDPRVVYARPARQREAMARADAVRWTGLAAAARRAVEGQLGALGAVSVRPTDTAAVSPVGFDPLDGDGTQAPALLLTRAGRRGGLVGSADGVTVLTLPSHGLLDERDTRALRPYRHVELDATEVDGPMRLAQLLSQLLVAGVPMRVPAMPLPVARLLGRPLTALLASASPQGFRDPWSREQWSVAARREALLRFGAGLPGYDGATFPVVSVVTAASTADQVQRVLRQLAHQKVPTELVVGHPGELDTWTSQVSHDVAVTTVNLDPGVVPTLRALVDRCGHDVVAVMDPEQRYGRNHLRDLLLARAYSGMEAVASAGSLTYVEALDVTVRVQVSGPERLASGAAAGTLLASRVALSRIGDGDESAAIAALADEGALYATHGTGVLRRIAGLPEDLRVLGGGARQWSGLMVPPDLRGTDVGSAAARLPRYRSYFAA